MREAGGVPCSRRRRRRLIPTHVGGLRPQWRRRPSAQLRLAALHPGEAISSSGTACTAWCTARLPAAPGGVIPRSRALVEAPHPPTCPGATAHAEPTATTLPHPGCRRFPPGVRPRVLRVHLSGGSRLPAVMLRVRGGDVPPQGPLLHGGRGRPVALAVPPGGRPASASVLREGWPPAPSAAVPPSPLAHPLTEGGRAITPPEGVVSSKRSLRMQINFHPPGVSIGEGLPCGGVVNAASSIRHTSVAHPRPHSRLTLSCMPHRSPHAGSLAVEPPVRGEWARGMTIRGELPTPSSVRGMGAVAVREGACMGAGMHAWASPVRRVGAVVVREGACMGAGTHAWTFRTPFTHGSTNAWTRGGHHAWKERSMH